MGACTPNLVDIIRVDYQVPVPVPLPSTEKIKDVHKTLIRKRSLSEKHHFSKSDIQVYEEKTVLSGKLERERPHQTRRSTLFKQITQFNSLYQTKATSVSKHFGTEQKRMTEIKTKGLFLPEDQSILSSTFQSHCLLSKLDAQSILSIINKLKKYQIEENDIIFLEGEESNSMFLIIVGKVELSKLGSHKIIVKSTKECFGEIGILEEKALRTYNARGIANGYLYEITNDSFESIKSHIIKEDTKLETMIENVPLFKYLDKADKDNLIKFAFLRYLKQNANMKFDESFYIVNKGKLVFNLDNQTIEMTSNMFYGMNNLLFASLSQEITAKENSEIYILPLQAFIEILGIDYHYQLVYPYFKHVMSNNKFFSNLFNELQLVPIYELFSLHQYTQKSIVCPKGTSGKIIIVIKGKLIYQSKCNDIIEFKFGQVYGDQLITSGFVLDNDIIAKCNSIILECEWEEMKAKVPSFNSSIVKKMNKLHLIEFMRYSNESKLLEIASIVQKMKYKKKELICNKDFNNNYFFLIHKGEAKFQVKNKTIRRYGKGSCFGEMYVLEIEDQGSRIITSSESISLYLMPGEYFKNLIGDNKYNDYIKKKMCIEDREIAITDLYCYKEISKRCYIAHNSIEFYFIKTYNKNSPDYNMANNACKAMKHLDHPFIVQYVKSIEVNNLSLFIYDYIKNSISLEQLIQLRQKFLSKKSCLLLYSASVVLALDYMHSKYFMHRNITPENIIIDSSGYIKLINFSNSIKPKNKLSTSSLVGIPCYTAPEILKGDNYSMSCDYWSLGIVLYYFYFDQLPFDKKNEDPLAMYSEIIDKDINYNKCDIKVKGLLNALLETNNKKRCSSISMVKQLNLFQKFNFDDVLTYKLEPQFIPSNNKDNFDNILLQSKDNKILSILNKRNSIKESKVSQSWANKF